MIKLTQARHFRSTPGVKFDDITVEGSNGIDLVEHSGPAVSPPDHDGEPRWYVHRHQVDNNRVIHGERLFELYNLGWKHPHWFVYLDSDAGALQIPIGCYHRSYSGKNGSLLINHAVRDDEFDEITEFVPRCILADLAAPRYHGITPYEASMFIQYGVYD